MAKTLTLTKNNLFVTKCNLKSYSPPTGLEPAISGLGGRRLIH